MRGQVLERIEAGADVLDLLSRQWAAVTIEVRDHLPQGEITCGPGARPTEVAGEEPVRRPLPDPRQCDERCLDLVVRQVGECAEVEAGAGEREDVVGLPPRVAQSGSDPLV